METFAFVSAVRGYHVYQNVFTPSIGEKMAQNFSKKVRLIHKSLWYMDSTRVT